MLHPPGWLKLGMRLLNKKNMDKKTALTILLENSIWLSNDHKKNILEKLDTLTPDQIDRLGKFLAEEREVMVANKDQIIKDSQTLLETIEDLTLNPDNN